MENTVIPISVFGATGFIGSRFCEMYPDNTTKVPRDSNISPTNEVCYFISTIDNYNVHKDLKIDINTNLIKLMDVLENIKSNPNIVFNFISSWFVYGQNNEIPFKENTSKCNPTGFYSITKHCAEQLLISFCNTFNIKYRIFRLANVLGEGDNKISRQKNALQFLIKEVVDNKDIPLYYGGKVLRDYIYVDDVCRALFFCIKHAPHNEIINVGNGIPYEFIELIEKAILYSNSTSKILHIQPTQFHNIVQVRHSYLNIEKLDSYGHKNIYDIDTVIKKLIAHYKQKI